MILTHIIFGLIFVVLGALGLKYNYQLVGFTGEVGFIENKLGSGSTYGVFKLLSVLLCLGGFLYMTGLMDPILHWALSPLDILVQRDPSAS